MPGQSNQPKNLEDSFLVMKRSKIAQNWRDVQASHSVTAKYFEPIDLYCGKIVDIYGRTFLLTNCDAHTREVYRSMGVDLNEIDIIPYEEKPVEYAIPKRGDGFIAIGGDEGD